MGLGPTGSRKQRPSTIGLEPLTIAPVEVHRIAGEIALKTPEPDAAKAEAYFERALAVARGQQAKSSEMRAAMPSANQDWEEFFL